MGEDPGLLLTKRKLLKFETPGTFRLKFSEDDGNHCIEIPTRWSFLGATFSVFGIIGSGIVAPVLVTIILIDVTGVTDKSLKAYISLAVALLVWLLVCLPLVLRLCWKLFGYEIITFDNKSLTLCRKLLIIQRSKHYRMSDVARIRWAENPRIVLMPFLFFYIFSRKAYGAVHFDYGPRTIVFGKGLDSSEGSAVTERIGSLLDTE